MRDDVIYLIAEDPEAHGVYDEPQKTERMVYVTVRSVGMRERYAAMAANHDPEAVFELADYAEYQGEKTLRWGENIYTIVRAYEKGTRLELTAERKRADDV